MSEQFWENSPDPVFPSGNRLTTFSDGTPQACCHPKLPPILPNASEGLHSSHVSSGHRVAPRSVSFAVRRPSALAATPPLLPSACPVPDRRFPAGTVPSLPALCLGASPLSSGFFAMLPRLPSACLVPDR